ncbi:site-2 protease family protein [Phytohabitans flavus]|uniref:site-2 protease family protein n=1 Tax=Phytohabitans flavus TaxID=1076124 RepID=UPI0031EF6462
MTASFRLGRIAGVPVGVNWSVLVIFVLIAGGLSIVNLPRGYPGYAGWAYALAGILAAVIFFLGLLAHEVSHAIVAQRNGLQVQQITLWLFGGVAEIRGEARDPGAEVRIAGIGPLVSLIIGVVFGVAAAIVAAVSHRGLFFGALAWLAAINLALAVFNVLPAAPLDGGRLLRAALWKWRGDRVWAAIASARAGRVLGAALIAVGLWQFLTGNGIGGLWLALIGWFLWGAAGAEERQTRATQALAGVHVGDVMTAQPSTVSPDASVAEFVDHDLMQHRHTAFPLTDAGRPVGLVTLDRVRQVPFERRQNTKLRDIACPADQLTLTTPQEELTELLPRLNGCSDGRALVVADHQLVGIVSPSDVSRAVEHRALRHGTMPGNV